MAYRVLVALVVAGAAGCHGSAGSGSPDGATAAGPTFHKDVEPILEQSCQRCHWSGGIGPFSLVGYQNVTAVGSLIAGATQQGIMPPWGALETGECQPRLPWRDDLRLPAAEIATIGTWVQNGMPEGNPADAPPPLMLPIGGLSQVDLELAPSTPFTPQTGADQYRCFVLDPGATQTLWMSGFALVPGNPRIVHHALVFLDQDGSSTKLADASGGYDCFGGPGISSPLLLGAWAPGSPPFEPGPNIAMPIPAGSRLVMQVHYHPATATTPIGADATKFQMRLVSQVPQYVMAILLLGNIATQSADGQGLQPDPDDRNGMVEFRIPAGATHHTETMRFAIPQLTARSADGGQHPLDLRLHSVGSHMHYLGTDMKISIEHSGGAQADAAVDSECLLETPRWDFHWQRLYTYDAPVDQLPLLRAGDMVTLRCTYDNSLDNPAVVAALGEQGLSAPRDVVLGEGTLDEMCLAAGAVVVSSDQLDLSALTGASDGGAP
jgi:hypothetical protein